MRRRVGPREVLGLSPLGPALAQCRAALAGDSYAPPSRFGPSSLRILRPWISLPLWLGRTRADRRAVVYNLPNRHPPPRLAAYSVRSTFARDFRGLRLTYDSHNGTDLAVPVGTEVDAAAPGVVVDVRTDLQRGGRKVCVDHGAGLLTMSNHLARALVSPGQRVARGQVLGVSGMSGVDGVLLSPWLAPHVHFTVLLGGVPADPWARQGEESLWRSRNAPVPHEGGPETEIEPTEWSEHGVRSGIETCRDPSMRADLLTTPDPAIRAARLAILSSYFPHRFTEPPAPCARAYPRRPHLDLPLLAEDYVGTVFADELRAS